eukprot:357778-Chlamydomonas_euryale.AAC.6
MRLHVGMRSLSVSCGGPEQKEPVGGVWTGKDRQAHEAPVGGVMNRGGQAGTRGACRWGYEPGRTGGHTTHTP